VSSPVEPEPPVDPEPLSLPLFTSSPRSSPELDDALPDPEGPPALEPDPELYWELGSLVEEQCERTGAITRAMMRRMRESNAMGK
jgi:hypothetical protein